MIQLTNGTHAYELVLEPKVDILNILCDYQFSSPYLMNFMFYIMLDAGGVVLRVHYKSMKCEITFSQGSISTIFR